MTKAQMQPEPLEQLKSVLSEVSRGHDFLAEYVREQELHREEDDTFRRLAFQDVMPGAAYNGSGILSTSVFSDLYEPLNSDQKIRIRGWWNDKVRREAEEFTDLKTRLAKLR